MGHLHTTPHSILGACTILAGKYGPMWDAFHSLNNTPQTPHTPLTLQTALHSLLSGAIFSK